MYFLRILRIDLFSIHLIRLIVSQKHSFHLIDLATLRKVSSLFAGNYRTSFHGSGMEFAEIREYAAGDDVRSIDWKTTAKTGKAFIKKYEEDRERRVLFLVDVGESMRFGSGERSKFDTLAELFSILSFSSVENGDPTGAWLYSDAVLEKYDPKKWHPHLAHIRTGFDAHRSSVVSKISDLHTPIESLVKNHIRDHLVFIITDATEWIEDIPYRAIGKQNDAIFIHIFDSFENTLESADRIHAISGDTDLYIDATDEKKRIEYTKKRGEDLEIFKKNITRLGWSYLALDEQDNVYKKLYDFFKRRQGR